MQASMYVAGSTLVRIFLFVDVLMRVCDWQMLCAHSQRIPWSIHMSLHYKYIEAHVTFSRCAIYSMCMTRHTVLTMAQTCTVIP